MIQRIQSIYFLLAGVSAFSLFALPFAKVATATQAGLFQDSNFSIFDNIALIALFVLVGVTALGAIFLYNNRPNQLKLSLFSIILALLGVGLAAFLFFQDQVNAPQAISDDFGLGMPLFTILFNWLANRSIRKDEALVKSMDRLR